MLSRERLDWQTRDITRLWSDLFTVCSQALVRRYNKGHHQSYSSSSIKVVVVRLGQIGCRCEIKKMLSNERLDWPTRDITRLWSDLFTVYSQALVRQYNKRHHHLAHHPRSKLLLLGLVKSMRWSDICLLFTTTLWSEHVSRRE